MPNINISTTLNDRDADADAAPPKRRERAPYHGAALGVLSCLFHEHQRNGDIAIIDEYRLSKEPLRIDILVKKNRDVELERPCAKIFRGHNVLEFKSPADKAPNVDVFHKLFGYALIYSAQEGVKISDMTATLICCRTPKKLLKTLGDELGYEILEKSDGIYYITEKGAPAEKRLAFQIVTQKSELLLQALDKRRLDEATMGNVVEFVATLDEENKIRLAYWFKALSQENSETLYERVGKNMTPSQKVLKKFAESWGFMDEARQEGLQEGLQKGRQEGRQEARQEVVSEVFTLLEKGYSLADVKKKLLGRRKSPTTAAKKKLQPT